MRLRPSHIITFLAVVSAVSALANFSIDDVGNDLVGVKTRRKKGGKSRSTSSSSGDRGKDGEDDKSSGSSLDMTSSSSSSEENEKTKNNKYKPKSTEERRGWKKWHRKCAPCPKDMVLKWRDPQIKWICGGYQRARRSFKSLCMMHYRNCQDGTMFVMIHSHRCANDTKKMDQAHGDHFFYDYKASLSDESSKKSRSSDSDSDSDSDESKSSSSSGGTIDWRRAIGKSASPHVKTTIANITVGTTTKKM